MKTYLSQVDLRDELLGQHNISSLPENGGITSFLSTVLPNAYVLAGIILFIYAIAGGFMLITNAGNTEQTQKGKQIITNATIGFIVIFTSYWIIEIISTITGINILNANI